MVATGEAHSLEEFAALAFAEVGLDWHDYVRTDQKFFRPAEVDHLIGNAGKAERVLGWEPSIDFPRLVRIMVEADLVRHGVTTASNTKP